MRNRSSARLAASTQCRSSMTNTMGRSREKVSSSTAMPSCSWPVAAPTPAGAAAAAASASDAASSGRSATSAARPGPTASSTALGADLGDERAQRGLDRRVGRRDAAEVDALAGEQAARLPVAPRSNSRTSRVLPMPASPPMMTVNGAPARTSSRRSSSLARSASRPIMAGADVVTFSSCHAPPTAAAVGTSVIVCGGIITGRCGDDRRDLRMSRCGHRSARRGARCTWRWRPVPPRSGRRPRVDRAALVGRASAAPSSRSAWCTSPGACAGRRSLPRTA